MTGCKSGCCGDCPGEKLDLPDLDMGRNRHTKRDISEYLNPLPKPHSDITSLNHPCKCNNRSDGIYRYQCLPCIKSWVNSVCRCMVKKEIEKYRNKSKITTERLEQCLKEKRQQERLDADRSLDDWCRDCMCK